MQPAMTSLLPASALLSTEPLHLLSAKHQRRLPQLAFRGSPLRSVRANRGQLLTRQATPNEKAEQAGKLYKQGGLNADLARKVLQSWAKTGATDEGSLRRLLRRRSLVAALGLLFQTVLDMAAATGGFRLGAFFTVAQDIPFHNVLAFGSTFIGAYYGIGVAFDAVTLGALVTASLRFQADSGALLRAVKETAGESGVDIIDKGKQAVNTAKVVTALQDMADLLQKEGSEIASGGLNELGVYLTLKNAEDKLGFEHGAKSGLDTDTARTIAALFSKYDTNNDFQLDFGEVKSLMGNLDGAAKQLGQDELKEAFSIVDKDHNNVIDFAEFTDLYRKKVAV